MTLSLVRQLLQNVEKTPSKAAVIIGEATTDYQTLGRWSAAVGQYLSNRIALQDRVAVLLDNGPEYIAALYGIWRAGGVAVTLNTALKHGDIARQLSHSGARWLIADASHPELPVLAAEANCQWLLSGELSVALASTALASTALAAATSLQTLFESASADTLSTVSRESHTANAAQSSTLLRDDSNPDEFAQILYTSGTTGHPKGVVLTHRNLAANIASIRACLPIRQDDRICCVLPFFYSYGNSVLHSHLASGATLVLENSMMYPHQVLQRMASSGVTAFAGVPSTYNLLLARTPLESFDLSSIRYCTQAGGAMNPEKIRQWQARLPTAEFHVMYGQTEATARLSCLPPAQLASRVGSVGVAIPGVTLSVRGHDDVALAAGETGEICAQGANVMAGYWRDEEETAKVLRNGWLHTGDLGYCDNDGYFYLVGRSSEMIKTGAHRVSPREIEALIATVNGVEDIAVVGMPDDIMGQLIKACVMVATNVEESKKSEIKRNVQRLCKEQLASYKVPKSVEFYDAFPRTSSGKIQKHLL